MSTKAGASLIGCCRSTSRSLYTLTFHINIRLLSEIIGNQRLYTICRLLYSFILYIPQDDGGSLGSPILSSCTVMSTKLGCLQCLHSFIGPHWLHIYQSVCPSASDSVQTPHSVESIDLLQNQYLFLQETYNLHSRRRIPIRPNSVGLTFNCQDLNGLDGIAEGRLDSMDWYALQFTSLRIC